MREFNTSGPCDPTLHYTVMREALIAIFFIQQLGGQTYIEIPSGRGQMDLLIRYHSQSYIIIEIKVFSTPTRFKQGKAQLAAYLQSEGLDEGYYVVFSSLHTEADDLYTEEVLDGKRIFTHIILTNVARPSELPVLQGGKS